MLESQTFHGVIFLKGISKLLFCKLEQRPVLVPDP